MNNLTSALELYSLCLKENPILVKSLIAGSTSAIGEIIGWMIKSIREKRKLHLNTIDWRKLTVFALYGFILVGPTLHCWYQYLDKLTSKLSKIPKFLLSIALDRLIFTPPFLLITLFFLKYFEGKSLSTCVREIRNSYKSLLIMNWKVWTAFQAINFTLVPVEYRTVFGNLVALWWNAYLSLSNRQAPVKSNSE